MTRFAIEADTKAAELLDIIVETNDGPPQATGQVAYLAAHTMAAWVALLEWFADNGQEAPEWVQAAVGALDEVTDTLAELLVYLDAIVPNVELDDDQAAELRVPQFCNANHPETAGAVCARAFGHAGDHEAPIGETQSLEWAPTDPPDDEAGAVPAGGLATSDPAPVPAVSGQEVMPCKTCGKDAFHPVEHFDTYGHWPEYA